MGLISGLMLGGGALAGGIAQGVTGAMAAGKQAGAARDAAALQLEGSENAIEEQRRQFEAYQRLMQPYQKQGGKAMQRLNQMMGMSGPQYGYQREDGTFLSKQELIDMKAAELMQASINPLIEKRNRYAGWRGEEKQDLLEMPEEFQNLKRTVQYTPEQLQQMEIERLSNDPLLQERIAQGEQAIQENALATASATGGLRGGNVQRLMADRMAQFRPQMIQQRINEEMAMLMGMQNMGMGVNQALGAAGTQMGANIGNLTMAGAGAQAQGALAQGAAQANMIGGIGGAIGGVLGMGNEIAGTHLGAKAMGKPGLF